jgi:hypothetical protein
MMAINEKNNEEEWRALIAGLSAGAEPDTLPMAPLFGDPTTRKRVGDLITKAVLGEPLYTRYKLYCGDSSSEL